MGPREILWPRAPQSHNPALDTRADRQTDGGEINILLAVSLEAAVCQNSRRIREGTADATITAACSAAFVGR